MSGTPYQNHRHHRRWVQFIATFMPAGQRAARRSRHRQARFPRPGDLLVQVQFRLGLPQQRPCLQLRQATCRRQQARRGTPDPSHTVRFKPVNQITTSTNAFRCKRSDTSGEPIIARSHSPPCRFPTSALGTGKPLAPLKDRMVGAASLCKLGGPARSSDPFDAVPLRAWFSQSRSALRVIVRRGF